MTVSPEAERLARQRPFAGIPTLPGAARWLPRLRPRIVATGRAEAAAIAAEHLEPPTTGEVAGVPTVELVPRGGATRRGLLVHLHGGAFVVGSAHDTTSALICAATGLRTISLEYPLAPEHPFPAAGDRVDVALDALLGDADAPVVLTGVSAGANLALGALRRRAARGAAQPQAAALFSPLADARLVGDSFRANRRRDPVLASRRQIVMARRLYARDHDLTNPDLSPVLAAVPDGLPPIMLVTGTRDLLLSDNVRLYWHLHRAGAAVRLRVWEGMWHSFTSEAALPEAEHARAEVAAFLTGHLCDSVEPAR